MRCNIGVRSRDHFCGRKAIIFTYCECVSVALGMQYVMRMRHIVICGLSGSKMFSHMMRYTLRLSEILRIKCVF